MTDTPTVAPTMADRIPVVLATPRGDTPAARVENMRSYMRTLDRAHLAIEGEPIVYWFQLSRREREWFRSECTTGGRMANDDEAGRALCSVGLRSVEGPHPLSEEDLDGERRRVGQVRRIPYEAALWDDETRFPEGCFAGISAIMHGHITLGGSLGNSSTSRPAPTSTPAASAVPATAPTPPASCDAR